MIKITQQIQIPDDELQWQFIRASGPGGQNVNKVATAVQLRFDVKRTGALPDDVRQRLMRIAGYRITKEGVLQINSQKHRTQERNRHDALKKLTSLIVEATRKPKLRKKTKPSKGAIQKRLNTKKQRGALKKVRKKPSATD